MDRVDIRKQIATGNSQKKGRNPTRANISVMDPPESGYISFMAKRLNNNEQESLGKSEVHVVLQEHEEGELPEPVNEEFFYGKQHNFCSRKLMDILTLISLRKSCQKHSVFK